MIVELRRHDPFGDIGVPACCIPGSGGSTQSAIGTIPRRHLSRYGFTRIGSKSWAQEGCHTESRSRSSRGRTGRCFGISGSRPCSTSSLWSKGGERDLKKQEACENARVPVPVFSEDQGRLVTFRSDILSIEYLRSLDPTGRQIGIVKGIRHRGRITNSDFQKGFGASKRRASEDLANLEKRGLIERRGTTGRDMFYVEKGAIQGH